MLPGMRATGSVGTSAESAPATATRRRFTPRLAMASMDSMGARRMTPRKREGSRSAAWTAMQPPRDTPTTKTGRPANPGPPWV